MKCPVCATESAEGIPVCVKCGTSLDGTLYDSGRSAATAEMSPADMAAVRAGIAPPGSPEALATAAAAEAALNAAAAIAAAAPTAPVPFGPAPAPTPAPAPPAPPAPAAAEVAARVLLSSVLAAPIKLEEGTVFRIGRDRASDVCFPSSHVSRLHAEIGFEKGSWVVGDLGSKNGTLVNGERVFKRALRNGDRVSIGHFEIVYRELGKAELASLRERKSERSSDTLKLVQETIGFFGDVKKLSILEVVQLLGQNRKTGVLTIHEEKGAPERRLHFKEGTIVHASFGSLEGERAVGPILKTKAGKFAFRPGSDGGGKATVTTATPTLLMQAMEQNATSAARTGMEGP